METKYKTHPCVKVVLLAFLISSCGHDVFDSNNAVDAKSQSVSSYLKLAFLDTKPDLILTGPTESYTQYGNYPRFGDVNGDGHEDLLVAGASRYNNSQGRLYLYYGGKNMDDKPDKIFTGEKAGDKFGEEAYLADVNGDNYADIITGSHTYNNLQGRIYIFYGGPDMDENADLIIDGEAGTQGRFGNTITAGDVNNDRYKDVVVSAIFYNNKRGRVYLFYGGDPMDTTADLTFDGGSDRDYYFGRDINNPKMVGDVNGYGYGDLLISSRYWNYWKGAVGQGRAHLYYGGPGTSMDSTCDKIFTGENERDDFGGAGCIFDIDNDGFDDVIIGVRGYNKGRGRVYLYWGGQDMDTIADQTFDGEGGSFGCGLDAGYVNGDEYGDFIVTAPYYGGKPWSGKAYLFYGDIKARINTICDKTFILPTETVNHPQHVALGDLHNDNYPEVAIGGNYYNNGQGRVWIYHNKPPGSTDEAPISLQEAASAGEVDKVKALISKGIDVNAGEWGSLKTALHYAAEKGRKKVVELLLAKGANTDARDALSTTPLHHAVEKKHKEVIELLIAKGADANAKDYKGRTPLWYAKRKGYTEIVELLRKHGAKE
ncbi:MAG: ankyrin repeat domain-containing protein [Phycisphaerae bacterium]